MFGLGCFRRVAPTLLFTAVGFIIERRRRGGVVLVVVGFQFATKRLGSGFTLGVLVDQGGGVFGPRDRFRSSLLLFWVTPGSGGSAEVFTRFDVSRFFDDPSRTIFFLQQGTVILFAISSSKHIQGGSPTQEGGGFRLFGLIPGGFVITIIVNQWLWLLWLLLRLMFGMAGCTFASSFVFESALEGDTIIVIRMVDTQQWIQFVAGWVALSFVTCGRERGKAIVQSASATLKIAPAASARTARTSMGSATSSTGTRVSTAIQRMDDLSVGTSTRAGTRVSTTI